MASFATEVKNELARFHAEEDCCRRAELSSLLRMGATVTLAPGHRFGINFSSENAAVARKVITLLRSMKQKLHMDVVAVRAKRLRKQNSYRIRIAPVPDVEALLEELGLMRQGNLTVVPDRSILRHSCCRAAYLRGAFLGGGSVNKPESSYHLELVSESYGMANFLLSLLRKLDFPVGITDRKEEYVVYLKEGDAVMDFLGMLQADKAVERFEVARNLKEVRAQVNRLVNCETANLQKAVNAAGRQTEDVRTLQARGMFDSLPEQLRETGEARLAHPEATMAELAEILRVSKSGLNHRLRKLHELAKE